MYDTIKAATDDFQIDDSAHLTVVPHCYDLVELEEMHKQKDLFETKGGLVVEAAKAFMNLGEKKKFNISVNVEKYYTGKKVEKNSPEFQSEEKFLEKNTFLSIQFNPSKILYGHNIGNLTKQEVEKSFDVVKTTINQAGIDFDFDSCYIQRQDLGLNIQTDEKETAYIEAFRSMPMSRRLERIDYGSTVFFRNKSRQFICYSKTEEIIAQKQERIEGDENLLRFESRLMNKRVNKGQLLKELIPVFDELKEDFKTALVGKLSQMRFDATRANLIEDIISQYAQTDKKRWFAAAVRDIGMLTITESFTGKGFSNLLKRLGMSKGQLSAVNNMFDEVAHTSALINRKNIVKELVTKIKAA